MPVDVDTAYIIALMSEAKARATTRQLRRAMGAEAIGVVNNHAAELQALDRRVTQHEQEIRKLMGVTATDGARITRHAGTLDVFTSRTLGQRLHWLVTGR